MNTNIINWLKLGLVLLTFTAITSCQYNEIASANYPDELIYLPAAINGVYAIDNLPESTLADPTSGNTYRFTINRDSNQFNVPLAVYRSGIKNVKSITVDIAANTDTVAKLIAKGIVGMENAEVLPATMYSLNSSVKVNSGSNIAHFNLAINLDFLMTNTPTKKYALGVTVSSLDSKSNPVYNTVIVLVDTRIMTPIPEFNFQVDNMNKQKVTFMNASKYVISSVWDFGDGATSTVQNPVHIYNAAGTYTVKLNATGLYGNLVEFTKTVSIAN